MEINQIKQFRVIARTESLSKAAEQLFVAQPSLSQTLKRIETELGTQLFDRCGRRIVLNGAGEIFLKYCDEIVLALDNAEKEISEYVGSEKSQINIRVESTSLMILEVAEKMRQNYPWSLPHFYQGICDDWDLNICFDIAPDCGAPSKVVLEEPLGIILPESHPLASKSAIYKKDLEGCDFLSLNQSDGLTGIITLFCARSEFKPNVTMYVDSPSVIQELVKRNFGIAFAPQYTWRSYYENTLIFKLVEDMPMRQFVHVVLNSKKRITTNVRRCYDAIVSYYIEYANSFTK